MTSRSRWKSSAVDTGSLRLAGHQRVGLVKSAHAVRVRCIKRLLATRRAHGRWDDLDQFLKTVVARMSLQDPSGRRIGLERVAASGRLHPKRHLQHVRAHVGTDIEAYGVGVHTVREEIGDIRLVHARETTPLTGVDTARHTVDGPPDPAARTHPTQACLICRTQPANDGGLVADRVG